MASPVLLVVGAGPGLGASVARRFGQQGYAVALIARSGDKLQALAEELRSDGIAATWAAADMTDGPALTDAVTGIGQDTGRIDVVHFNPSAFRHKDPLELTPDELLADVRLGVASLLTVVQAARRFMSSGGRITVTGSMAADHPWNEAASLGVQKAGVRNLVRSLDATLAPAGIRATSLTVRGTLAPDTAFSPDRVAEALHAVAMTPDDQWQAEMSYEGMGTP